MKWLIVASLVGEAWAVLVLILSLVFGPALPVSVFAMWLSAMSAVLIMAAGQVLAHVTEDNVYRKLHRFGRPAKGLLLLYLALAALGITALAGAFGRAVPTDPVPATRMVAGFALIMYAAAGVTTLIRMHYRPVVRR